MHQDTNGSTAKAVRGIRFIDEDPKGPFGILTSFDMLQRFHECSWLHEESSKLNRPDWGVFELYMLLISQMLRNAIADSKDFVVSVDGTAFRDKAQHIERLTIEFPRIEGSFELSRELLLRSDARLQNVHYYMTRFLFEREQRESVAHSN